MDKLRIVGGNKLNGKIYISGAKNAALPLMCASLLTDDEVVLTNMPTLSDINFLNDILETLGTQIKKEDDVINGNPCKKYTYKTLDFKTCVAPYDLVRKMRASYYVLGPLLTRNGYVELSLPGGCVIGTRPMDIHLSALEQMGADIEIKNGYVFGRAKDGLHGANLQFKVPSVGATCNVLMAATLAEGRTVINNAAREPEISDLANMLNSMGAKIDGIGTSVLTIEGVKKIHGTKYNVMSDRIEAGSYAVAAAITRGRLELINATTKTLEKPVEILRNMGVDITETENSMVVDARNANLTGQDIITMGYPGFPTDLQAQFMALMTIANGASMITETIFENRFMHVPELVRMGANINVQGNSSAIVRGVEKLTGAPVMASDLRASFALVLAGLVADGTTEVNRVYHMDRGYENIEEKLHSVGANIERISE